MTPIDALFELMERVGACSGAPVHITVEEMNQWPSEAVSAMRGQKLILEAPPASSAACPGCELECVMPVHTPRASNGRSEPFIVCDKRSDINRVAVSAARLSLWRCSAEVVCDFVANILGLRRSRRQKDESGLWEIGIAAGKKRRQMLCLKADGEMILMAGNRSARIAELVAFDNGEFLLDDALIRQLIDSGTMADPRYTPSDVRREARKLDTQAMYDSWWKAYRELQKRRPGMSDTWYSKQIAKMDIANNRSSETIRKNMKR
jgi:hypothetical protein